MDLITNLPKTGKQHDAIMVFVDKLTKFVRFAPTTTECTATGAARLLLVKVFFIFGLHQKLITDRDTRFTSYMFQEFCKLFGMDQAL